MLTNFQLKCQMSIYDTKKEDTLITSGSIKYPEFRSYVSQIIDIAPIFAVKSNDFQMLTQISSDNYHFRRVKLNFYGII